MKKLIALAAMAACSAAAQAQSNVTIYGDLDQYFGYIKSSSGQSVFGLNDGAFLKSRIGFRGAEDLGDGYQAIFDLENGFYGNTGALNDSSRLFDRQSWVGIKTSSGQFRVGRITTAIFDFGAAIDYTERTTYGSMINTFGVPSRFDNDISFRSARFANFLVDLDYAMPAKGTDSIGHQGVYQFALDYQNAPFRAGYMGLVSAPESGATVDTKIQYHNAYVDYDYGQGKIYFAYVRSNNVTSNANGDTAATILSNVGNPTDSFPGTDTNANRFFNIYQVSADYWVSPTLKVGALYGVIVDTSGGNAGASGGNVGAFYYLSKRTMLYGFANYMKNQANAGFRFSGSAAPSDNLAGTNINGRSLIGLESGILVKF